MFRLFITMMVLLAASSRVQADPLEAASIAQAQAQDSQAAQVGAFLRGAGEKTDFQVLLEAGKCYWFSGASQGLSKFYMYLWAPNAKFFTPRLTDAKSTSNQVTLAHCATAPGMYKFQVKTEGSGPYVVGIFAKDAPKGAAAPAVAAQPQQKKIDLTPIIEKEAAGTAPGATRVGAFLEGVADKIGADVRDWSLSLEEGKCYWFIGAGDPERIKKFALYLWGPNNKRVTESKSSTPNAMVGHCPVMGGIFKLQAKIGKGKGDFMVGVYAKKR